VGESEKPAPASLDAQALVDLPAKWEACGFDSSVCRLDVTRPCCRDCRCDLPVLARIGVSRVERDEQIGTELARLRSAVAAMARVQITSVRPAPSEPRHSLPVRAAMAGARGGYKLTKGAAAVLGLVVTLAEVLAPDHAVLRAILRALIERL
jgi:hypothetical protein